MSLVIRCSARCRPGGLRGDRDQSRAIAGISTYPQGYQLLYVVGLDSRTPLIGAHVPGPDPATSLPLCAHLPAPLRQVLRMSGTPSQTLATESRRRARVRRTDLLAACSGLAAGTVALYAGQVGSRLLSGATPPLQALGDLVIRETPVGVTTRIIELVGQHDKTVLRSSVLVVATVMLMAIGVLEARGYRRSAFTAVALLALAPVVAVGTAPTGNPSREALVLLPAGLLGALVLRALNRPFARTGQPGRDRSADGLAGPAAVGRRQFLRAAAVLVAAAGAGQVAFRALGAAPASLNRRLRAALPTPIRPLPPVLDEFTGSGASPLITPTGAFYRVDIALEPPIVDPETWTLTVSRNSRPAKSWTYDEILALATEEADITIGCVDNAVGGDLIGSARWQGVLLSDVLKRSGIEAAGRLRASSVDGFVASFPTSFAFDRPSMIAVGMNGRPLPIEHGFPARIVVPGLYGFTSAVKWVSRIDVSDQTALPGFWADRGWTPAAPVRITSRIDHPVSGTRLTAEPTRIAGIAWAPTAGVGTVEIQIDDGPWTPARLSQATTGALWRQFVLDWTPTPGTYRVKVRAADMTGAPQDTVARKTFPSGATGLHQIQIEVA